MLFALTLTTLAGLSTGLGGLVVLLFKRPRARMMAFSMGFAGGVMLTVSLSDMLPHTVETYSDTMGRFPAALASASLCVMGMLIAGPLAAGASAPMKRSLRPARTGMRRVGRRPSIPARCAALW